jgi:hypothetical protein
MVRSVPDVILEVFELPAAAAMLREVLDGLPMLPSMREAAAQLAIGARFIVVSTLDGGRVWRPADEREVCAILTDARGRAVPGAQVRVRQAVEPATGEILSAWIERLGAMVQ